jgi:hypothetical protein
MDTEQIETGDRPEWLGSLARQHATTGEMPEGFQPRVVESAPEDTEGTWNGSPVRRSLFEGPGAEPEPELLPEPAPLPAAPPQPQGDGIHVLPGKGRIVMGELGMTIRAA